MDERTRMGHTKQWNILISERHAHMPKIQRNIAAKNEKWKILNNKWKRNKGKERNERNNDNDGKWAAEST